MGFEKLFLKSKKKKKKMTRGLNEAMQTKPEWDLKLKVSSAWTECYSIPACKEDLPEFSEYP